jgi:hypothetical protein
VWLDLDESRESLELSHVPPAIARAGIKVYVLGARTPSGVDVERFGVIRDTRQ